MKGREGGREGWREGGMEGGREGRKELTSDEFRVKFRSTLFTFFSSSFSIICSPQRLRSKDLQQPLRLSPARRRHTI